MDQIENSTPLPCGDVDDLIFQGDTWDHSER